MSPKFEIEQKPFVWCVNVLIQKKQRWDLCVSGRRKSEYLVSKNQGRKNKNRRTSTE